MGGHLTDNDVAMLYDGEDLSGVDVSDMDSETLLSYDGEESSAVTLSEDSSVVSVPVSSSVASPTVGNDVKVLRPSLAVKSAP